MQARISSDINTSDIEYVKAKNDSAVAGASEHWAEMPAVAGYLFVRIITSTRNVVGMGILP